MTPSYYSLGETHPVMNTLASSVQPDFELRADPSNVTLALDDIANITIRVHSVGGFNEQVKLELTRQINSDVGPSCPNLDHPPIVTPGPDAAWSFTCTSGDNDVSYTLYVKGTATTTTSLQHIVAVTLNFKASDVADTNSSSSISRPGSSLYSVPLIYMIGAGVGAFLITLIALTTYFAKRRHVNATTKP